MKPAVPQISKEKMQYLELLAEKYPTIQQVCTEIINLQAILNLPKGTEHFISDVHGEYEAFCHILNNCSGVIREKISLVFGDELSKQQQDDLCTLVYYPVEKLALYAKHNQLNDDFYEEVLLQLIALCRSVASKYTRSKVRKALPDAFSYIIDELLHAWPGESQSQCEYHKNIIYAIINLDNSEEFIYALAQLIKRLAVDRLHLVGDIYDRGSGAQNVMEMLINHHSVDIQWGNHDILWMGAAAQNRACIATVIKNSMFYHNYHTLENGYGISLRPLFLFAETAYPLCATAYEAAEHAIAVLMFKLEGEIIRRRGEYGMQDRLLLEAIDYSKATINIKGKEYPLKTCYFPTIDPSDPYALTPSEENVITQLCNAFAQSERLQRHVKFLYAHGSMYLTYNQNLLFHGCVPMSEEGQLKDVSCLGYPLQGKALLDALDAAARSAYFGQNGNVKEKDRDLMWYLWCGHDSPLFGRDKMTTFERMFISDESVYSEGKDPYYTFCEDEKACDMILRSFEIYYPGGHIVNGHVPVKAKAGESPVKANGKLIVIDGGMCKAYQPTTGLAGYTLIYNSQGMRILSHTPFNGQREAVLDNADIVSEGEVFETEVSRVLVRDTDIGNNISSRIYDLTLLLHAYREGKIIVSN